MNIDEYLKIGNDSSFAEELLERWAEEIKKETTFNRATLEDTQMGITANRHKWVAQLCRLKFKKAQAEEYKFKRVRDILGEMRKTSPGTSDPMLKRKAEATDEVVKITRYINNIDILITYLEYVERGFNNMGYGIRNIVDWVKMEG